MSNLMREPGLRYFLGGLICSLFLYCGATQKVVKKTETPEEIVEKLKTSFNEGLNALTTKNYAEAERHFKAVLDINDKMAEAYFNLGKVYEQKGESGKAIEAFKKASTLKAGFGDGYASIGLIYLRQRNFEMAKQYLEEALRVDKYNLYALTELSNIYRIRKEAKLAVDGFIRKALNLDAQNLLAYANLAYVYYELRLYDIAELVCVNALEIKWLQKKESFYRTEQEFKKQRAAIYNNLGLIYLGMRRVRNAYTNFRRALEEDPLFVPAHLNIGAITLNYHDNNTALKHFDAVLTIDPKNIMARLSKAVALRKLNRFSEAETEYKKIFEYDKNNAAAYFNLGILLYEKSDKADSDLKAALEYFNKFLALDGGQSKSLDYAAKLRIKDINYKLKLSTQQPKPKK